MATSINVKDLILWVFISLAVVTIINLIVNSVFSSIPVFKSGPFFLLLISVVVIILLFSIVYDKKIEKSEIFFFLVVIATAVGFWYVTKTFLPQIYSLIPDATKQAFSIIP